MKFKEIKTIGKVAIYLSAIMVVAFAVAFGVFFSPGVLHARGGVERAVDGERMNIDDMEETAFGGISRVIIETSSPDVILQPVDGDMIRAELKGYLFPKSLAEAPILRMSENGGIVTFETEFPKGFVFREMNLLLTVYIPELYEADIKIKTASGDVEIAGHNLKEMEVKTASGEVEVSACSLSALQIGTASGDVKVDRVKSNSMTADTVSGSIVFEIISGESVRADSTSGDFRGQSIEAGRFSRSTVSGDTGIEDFTGQFFCKSVSGTIKSQFVTFEEDMEVRSTSGDVILRLPDVPGFDLHVETTSGDIDCDWPITMTVGGKVKDNRLVGTVGDGGPALMIKTTSGDVEIVK